MSDPTPKTDETTPKADQVMDNESSNEVTVDNLKISEAAAPEQDEVTKVVKSDDDDEGSVATSDDEPEKNTQELESVINELQTTFKEQQNKKEEESAKLVKEDVEEDEEEEEEQLHSGDDHDSKGHSSEDESKLNDNDTSTTVSVEEDKLDEQVKENIQTFDELVEDISPPTPGVPPTRQFDIQNSPTGRPSEDVGDVESYSANLIALNKIDTKEIKANHLSPRQQEKAGKLFFLYIFPGIGVYSHCHL